MSWQLSRMTDRETPATYHPDNRHGERAIRQNPIWPSDFTLRRESSGWVRRRRGLGCRRAGVVDAEGPVKAAMEVNSRRHYTRHVGKSVLLKRTFTSTHVQKKRRRRR